MITSRRAHVAFLLLTVPLSLQCSGESSGSDTDATSSGGAGPTTAGGGSGPTTASGGSGPTTGGGGSGPTTTGGGGTDSGTTGGPASNDLFACGLDLSCTPVCSHLGSLGDCGGDASCVEGVWSSGERGDVVMFESRPGPGGYQQDTLFVLLGDGKVLQQRRSRQCPTDEPVCNLDAIAWSVEPQQRCEIGDTHTLEVKACRQVDYSCDEVEAELEADGSAGAAGAAGHAGEAAE